MSACQMHRDSKPLDDFLGSTNIHPTLPQLASILSGLNIMLNKDQLAPLWRFAPLTEHLLGKVLMRPMHWLDCGICHILPR